jgi:hypothetical protein
MASNPHYCKSSRKRKPKPSETSQTGSDRDKDVVFGEMIAKELKEINNPVRKRELKRQLYSTDWNDSK